MHMLLYLISADWPKKENERVCSVREGGTWEAFSSKLPCSSPGVVLTQFISPAQVINATLLQTKVASRGRGAGQSTTKAKGSYMWLQLWLRKYVSGCFVGHHSDSRDTHWEVEENTIKKNTHTQTHMHMGMDQEWEEHTFIVS